MERNNKTTMAFSLLVVFLALACNQQAGTGTKLTTEPTNRTASGAQWPPRKLEMDQALVRIVSNANETVVFWGISKNCYKCGLQRIRKVQLNTSSFLLINNTNFAFSLQVVLNHKTTNQHRTSADICKTKEYNFGEHGEYKFTIHKMQQSESAATYSCELTTDKDPENSFLPILYASLILLGAAVLWFLVSEVFRKNHRCAKLIFRDQETLINADLGSPDFHKPDDLITVDNKIEPTERSKPSKERLNSLDAFRGLSLMVMIFVNYGGGGYYFFKHSMWNGLTVADLVFPWFMWIMGVSMVFSFHSLWSRQVSRVKIFQKILRRTLILFALGLFVSNGKDLVHYRIPGVLQRFAACYFIVATMQLLPRSGSDPVNQPEPAWWNPIRDMVRLGLQWLIMVVFLGIYLVLTFAVALPQGCPRGYIGPGGIGEGYPNASDCSGGAASYIDRKIFGNNHVYQHGTFKALYHATVNHDPEGCLGTLTSAFLVFLGIQAGHVVFSYPRHVLRMKRWITWSVVLGLVAVGLTRGTMNEGAIPINKNLWSVSFILATGAMAFFLLTICYLLIDVLGWWNGAPFIYPGMNSILVYCGHELLGGHFPFSWDLQGTPTHADKLTMNLVGTGVWVLISYYMYTIKFFVKI